MSPVFDDDDRPGAESWTITDRYLAIYGRQIRCFYSRACSGLINLLSIINLSPQPRDKFRFPAPFAPIAHRIRVNERG